MVHKGEWLEILSFSRLYSSINFSIERGLGRVSTDIIKSSVLNIACGSITCPEDKQLSSQVRWGSGS